MHLKLITEGWKHRIDEFEKAYDGMKTPSGGVIKVREMRFLDIVFPEVDKEFVLNEFRGNHEGKEWKLKNSSNVPKNAATQEKSFKFGKAISLMKFFITLFGWLFNVKNVDLKKVEPKERKVPMDGMHLIPICTIKDKKVWNDSHPDKSKHHWEEWL